MSPPVSKAGEFNVAREAMAKAVMEHANQFYDVGGHARSSAQRLSAPCGVSV